MKFNELAAGAIQGPYQAGRRHGASRMLVLAKQTPDGREYDVGGIFEEDGDTTCEFIAHCCNKFPKALAALKLAYKFDCASRRREHVRNNHNEPLRQLIIELENVK
jgi:hypothetical protein